MKKHHYFCRERIHNVIHAHTATRREFLRLLGAGAGAALLSSAGRAPAAKAAATKRPPNIVFIISDDQGWNDIGYHESEIKTPQLDRLAKTGRRLERHYVMPTCTPTRLGLMTGRYPSRYGVLGPAYGDIFGDEAQILPGVLRERGYATHITGKWHMGSPPEYTPLKYGFDTSYGYFHGQIDPYTHLYKTGVKSWHRDDKLLDEEGHATDLITADAVRYIKAAGEKPFFLYVAYSVPHTPLKEPDKWTASYAHIKSDSRRWYAASTTHMDDGIGQIVKALDDSGKRPDTLLVFVSDNGGQKSWSSAKEYKGRYANLPHDVLGDNRPLRGWKGDVYEGGIRVPGLVNWPGVLEPGQVDAPLHIVDWLPTLCQGVVGWRPDPRRKLDGLNRWPVVSGQTAIAEPRTMYWKTSGASAVRDGAWKLVVHRKKGDKGGQKAELYNVAEDPLEKKDQAATDPARVATLLALLGEIAKDDRVRNVIPAK